MSTTHAATINKNDIESGRLFSILSYIIPFFFLVPMIQRTNAFATFHARQALAIIILAMDFEPGREIKTQRADVVFSICLCTRPRVCLGD